MVTAEQKSLILRIVIDRRDVLSKYLGRGRECEDEWAKVTEEVQRQCPEYNPGRVRTLFINWVSELRVSIQCSCVFPLCVFCVFCFE